MDKPAELNTPRLDKSDARAAEGATGRRATLADMKSRIVAQYAFTAAKAVGNQGGELDMHPSLGLLTIGVIVFDNGYTFTGTSACADPKNFDNEKGKAFALEDALSKAWSHEGFLLRERMWQEEGRPELQRQIETLPASELPPKRDPLEPFKVGESLGQDVAKQADPGPSTDALPPTQRPEGQTGRGDPPADPE